MSLSSTTSERAGAQRCTRLRDYRDRHLGETFVVCGCGESLGVLEGPERFVTIGVNDVERHFTPDYLVVVNQPTQFPGDRFAYIERSRARVLFTQLESLGVPHPHVVNFRLGDFGGCDFSDPDVLHYTQNSPYVALCLAVHMGARRIGLIGVDFTDHHFFAKTGAHPLASQLDRIDREYARLGEACRDRGVEVLNLSPVSRLTAFPKIERRAFEPETTSEPSRRRARIVSYATTPVAGVPLALARCIGARTGDEACCVWKSNDYGNGVRFNSDVEWERDAEQAEARLRDADSVIVHNGKVDAQHVKLLDGKALVTMAHNYMWNVDTTLVDRGFPGVVVGQYQATLPEFSGWDVVPNPIPLWEPAYRPGPKREQITVCYTPSGTHESYPSEHRLYWHAKGYDTTLRVLDRLAARHGLRVEAVRGRQVSHAESLAMKRRAHIVIDECVTGSYHRNSLEGLAAGCVVVNGMGLLPGVVDVLRRCAPDSERVPFVYADLASLEEVLESLVAEGAQSLAERGREGRAWIERHWSFERQWRDVWAPALSRARAVVRTTRVVSTRPHDIRVDRPPAEPRAWRPGVSVVVPHGGEDRLPHLRATLANLAQAAGVDEVIVAEMGRTPGALGDARRWGAKYVFVQESGAFERARTLNVGAALAELDLVLWKDNDLLLPPSFVEAAAAELRRRDLDNLLPYASIRYLSEEDTAQVFAGVADPAHCQPACVLYGGRDVSGGATLVRTRFLQKYGGIPEVFRGWGERTTLG